MRRQAPAGPSSNSERSRWKAHRDATTVRSLDESKHAANEALFRAVNERILELEEGFAAPAEIGRHLEFLCECGRTECIEHIALTREEYEEVRAESTYFVLMPRHENSSVERAISETERYIVVEKLRA